MAFLVKRKRLNQETGKQATYYLIGRWVEEGGKRTQRTAGIGFLSPKQAAAALARYEADLESGGDPLNLGSGSSPPSKKGTIPTLREWWGATEAPWPEWPECRMRTYLASMGVAPKTLRTWDDSRRMIVAQLGDLPLDRVGPADGDRFVAQLRAQGYSARTIQIRIDALRRSLAVAVEDGVIKAAPRLRRPKDEPHQAVFHTPDQTETLLAELDARATGRWAEGRSPLAVLLGVSLGMRPGEVLTRRWSHVDLEARTLRICPVEMPDGTRWQPKAGSARTLPLSPVLVSRLRELWMADGRADGWIFPRRGDPAWPQTTYKKALAGACEAADLPRLHPHALRHTAATRWVAAGVDIPTMMRIGGWRTSAVPLEVYAQTTPDRLREALERTEVGAAVDQQLLTSTPEGGGDTGDCGLGTYSGQPDSNRRPSAPKAEVEKKKARG